jgi:AraC family transcriptional regulator of adaptative response / methylphosphotriester-DNA alkyltransferase methyltransferase
VRPDTLASRRRLYLLARLVVSRHYRQPLTLGRVAGAVSSSPRQLQRAYAQFGETSFQQDLQARRMSVAAQLLAEQPAIAVRDVARLVGYRQAPHFARVFRGRYGVPPARFRAQAKAHRAHQASVRAGSSAVAPASAATGSARGSRRRISVPPPGAGSAVTRPPCWSATCRTIARPRPEPGRPRASAPR